MHSVETDLLGWRIPIRVSVSDGTNESKRSRDVSASSLDESSTAPSRTLNEQMNLGGRPPNILQLRDWVKAFVVEFALKTFGKAAARTLAKAWQCDDNAPHYFIYDTRMIVGGVGVEILCRWQDKDYAAQAPNEGVLDPPRGWMKIRVGVDDVLLKYPPANPLPSDAVIFSGELHVGANYCFEPIVRGGEQEVLEVFGKVERQFGNVLKGSMRDLAGRGEAISRNEARSLMHETPLWREAQRLFERSRNASRRTRARNHARMQQLLAQGLR